MTLLATHYFVNGQHATWYQVIGWWLVGMIVLVLVILAIFAVIRAIRNSGKKKRSSASKTALPTDWS